MSGFVEHDVIFCCFIAQLFFGRLIVELDGRFEGIIELFSDAFSNFFIVLKAKIFELYCGSPVVS